MVKKGVSKSLYKRNKPSKLALVGSMLAVAFLGGTGYLISNNIDPLTFYSNMANPYMKYVPIQPGMRKEELADKLSKVLAWNSQDKIDFLNAVPNEERGSVDGYYLPATYWLSINSNGKEVGQQMIDEFNNKVSTEVLNKKTNNLKQKVNLDTAVRIASIIQREAGGKSDMKLISGIIWNRIFAGMPLGMDATLQYVKGTEQNWWPQVIPNDKNTPSPFNTYKNKGLPPTAISNPSLEAIDAAYNPTKTDCMYYFHDNNRQIHCSVTYNEHKEKIQEYLVRR